MKKIKIKRITIDLFSDDELKLINKIYNQSKKGKLKKAKRNLEAFDLEELLTKFTDKQKLNKLEVDYLERIITIYKIFYSNDITLVDDIPYDQALNLLKSYGREPIEEYLVVSRRVHDVSHEFPELKGTIDKCNKLLDKDCERSNDKSLESYLRKWFLVNKEKYLILKLTVKFDGNSGVGTINNHKIVLLVSRGENGKGSDFTHLFKHIKFNEDDGKRRGVQFEIIMTKENLEKYQKKSGKKFSDLRSAVTSILTSSDGEKYSKYLSLAPIKMSDENEFNISDIEYDNLFNTYYGTYIENKKYHVKGEIFKDVLNSTFNVIDKISDYRDELNYQIDGVVIECMNKSVREVYVRKNDINQWMVAYKFPPQIKYPKVTGMKITIGRTGLATPNLYYTIIYFNGRKYDHSSISSAKRVENLNLRLGDIIGLSYNGDVMPYPFKYDCEENKNNKDKLIKFPKKCKCGSVFIRKGANYYCENPDCTEKIYDKLAFFYSTLGIRDISVNNTERLVKAGAITGFKDCLTPKWEIMKSIEGFGEKKINNFRKEIEKVKKSKISEAQLMNALGITGEIISKKILSILPLDCILKNKNLLYETEIYSIGEKIKNKFINNLFKLKDDVYTIRKQIKVIENKVNDNTIKIVFTGFRPDKELRNTLEKAGFEILNNYNNSVIYVITNDKNSNSGTMKKAIKNNKKILTLEEFNNVIKDMIEKII